MAFGNKKEDYLPEWDKTLKVIEIETALVENEQHTGVIGGLVTVQIAQGDITAETTDAITNAANSNLWLGAGVAGAIHSAGGDEVQNECRDYVKEHGDVSEGSCAATGSGRMKAIKYVIHTVGPFWSGSRP